MECNRSRTAGESRQLRELIDVAQVVVSSLDLDEVLQRILQVTRELMEVPAGSIALYNAEEQTMELQVAEGLSDQLAGVRRWKVEKGCMARTILDQDGVLVVEDTAKVRFFTNPRATAEGIRSVIAVPLKSHGQMAGILYLNDFVPRSFSAAKLEQLTIIASFASLSLVNARLYQQTRELAASDGLTGLYNHRQFKLALTQELARSQRYGHPLSLIMFDVDNFKHFNDTYGHPCGDQILTQIAAILRDDFRGGDQAFRYGGEEFTVLLPEATLPQARLAAERTRERIAETCIDWPDVSEQLRVTVSAGVATSPRSGNTAAELLSTVDELLYAAKHAGKNRTFSGFDVPRIVSS